MTSVSPCSSMAFRQDNSPGEARRPSARNFSAPCTAISDGQMRGIVVGDAFFPHVEPTNKCTQVLRIHLAVRFHFHAFQGGDLLFVKPGNLLHCLHWGVRCVSQAIFAIRKYCLLTI